MNAWAIKSQCFRPATGTILIEGRRRPGIVTSDHVILCELRSDAEVVFTAFGVVAQAEVTEDGRDMFVLTATLLDMVQLEPVRSLSDFAYSLQKIYIYELPGRHFLHQYASLGQADLVTLVKGNVFWARTAFGMFVNQLPEETLAEFVRFAAEAEPRTLIDRSDWASLWKLLQRYIAQEYVSAQQLLESISGHVAQLERAGVNIQFTDLRVGEGGNQESPDLLSIQHERLTTFVDSLNPQNERAESLFEAINKRIAANADVQAEFETAFRGTPWPLHRTKR